MYQLITQHYKRVAAQKAYEEGEQLRNQLTALSLRKAIEKYKEALQFWRAVGDRSQEVAALHQIGFVHQRLGERREALDYFNQDLKITLEITQNKPTIALAALRHSIASMYRDFGDMEKAIYYSNLALQTQKAAAGPDSGGEAYLLTGLGKTYNKLGEYQKALECYDKALQIERKLADPFGEARTLTCKGETYWSLSKMQEALDCFNQALRLQQDLDGGEGAGIRNEEATTLNNIGRVHDSMGEKLESLNYYRRAMQLYQIVGDQREEAYALNNIGRVYYNLGEKQKALEYFNQALPLRRAVGDAAGEAETLFGIAQVKRDSGDLIVALMLTENALGIIEFLRTKVAVQELRTSYFATVQNRYEFYIDLLMRLHKQNPSANYNALALQASENGRARGLLELLTEARADIRQGVATELLEQERSLQQQLNDKADYQLRLLSSKTATKQEDVRRELEVTKKEIERLTEELQEVEAKIRKDNPRYAAIKYPEPLNLIEIQQQVLDDNTLLLEYALGEQGSYLWAVTPTSVASYELPRREEIEASARRVYELLTARSRHGTNETPSQMRARVAKADAEYSEAAAALSRMVLGPVAAQLKTKRLVIVSDGALQYIPFAALPKPAINEEPILARVLKPGRANNNGLAKIYYYRPMFDNEIISLPSASTLAILRSGLNGRSRAPKIAAGIFDPVFEATDLRVKMGRLAEQKPGNNQNRGRDIHLSELLTTRALDDAGTVNTGQFIPRLSYSGKEAEAIEALVPEHLRKLAIGFEANYATATSPELSNYRIIHFATHVSLDSKRPEFSGLLLSLVDEQGKAQKNGMLRLGDIYNLKLSADLVVLSACQTALGKEIRGEGLVGLTRGFMYAGATRVVASLWKVDDEATAELMKRFYKKMLGPKQLRPADALRQAQIDMWRQREWHAPYYWSAFILQGEWK